LVSASRNVVIFHLYMQPLAINANPFLREVRERLLALSTAITGLVLAPSGYDG